MASAMDVKELSASDTVLCSSAKIDISAPASHVYDIVIHGNTWPEWNSFCPAVVVTPPKSGGSSSEDDKITLGAKLAVTVRMDPESPNSLRNQDCEVTDATSFTKTSDGDVTASETCYRVCWRALGFPRFLLRSLRTLEFVPTGQDTCEFRTWEPMAGPTARIIKSMYGPTLQARFEDYARDLKEYAEKTWKDGPGREPAAEE